MTEIGKTRIDVGKEDDHAVISVPHLPPMTVMEAEAVMCDLIDAIILAREIDGDPLPE